MAIFNATRGSKYLKPCNYADKFYTLECDYKETLTWTATKDCWLSYSVVGRNATTSVYTGYLYVNDDKVVIGDSKKPVYSGAPTLFVKRGSTVTLKNESSIAAYGCIG